MDDFHQLRCSESLQLETRCSGVGKERCGKEVTGRATRCVPHKEEVFSSQIVQNEPPEFSATAPAHSSKVKTHKNASSRQAALHHCHAVMLAPADSPTTQRRKKHMKPGQEKRRVRFLKIKRLNCVEITQGVRCVCVCVNIPQRFFCVMHQQPWVFFSHTTANLTAGTGDAHCVLEMCHSTRLHGGDLHRLCFTTIVKEEGGRWDLYYEATSNKLI